MANNICSHWVVILITITETRFVRKRIIFFLRSQVSVPFVETERANVEVSPEDRIQEADFCSDRVSESYCGSRSREKVERNGQELSIAAR